MRIFFLVPDHEIPSWGMGMIYHLTNISTDLGLDACILRMQERITNPSWLDLPVKQLPLQHIINTINAEDILIVPDIMAADQAVQALSAQKVIFIQGSVMIPLGLKSQINYQALGFRHSLVIMPHIQRVLDNFWPIETTIVSPFIADYFFTSPEKTSITHRKKQILLYPKPAYQEAGYYDYEIAAKVLRQELEKINNSHHKVNSHWSVAELKDKSHREVAKLMQESIFFINTNCFESFNTTVPEAMAAGCINFCYEAFGGQDFLINEKNAFVFPNNYIYPLLSKLIFFVNNLEEQLDQLTGVQQNGIATARRFIRSKTKMELKIFYQKIGVLN